jgi:hypothetical protein
LEFDNPYTTRKTHRSKGCSEGFLALQNWEKISKKSLQQPSLFIVEVLSEVIADGPYN